MTRASCFLWAHKSSLLLASFVKTKKVTKTLQDGKAKTSGLRTHLAGAKTEFPVTGIRALSQHGIPVTNPSRVNGDALRKLGNTRQWDGVPSPVLETNCPSVRTSVGHRFQPIWAKD